MIFKSPEYSPWWVALQKTRLTLACTQAASFKASHLEDEAFCGPSIHSQDNVTSCNGPILLSWLPWEEPLNSHEIILEVAAVLSLHLHKTESQTTSILFQFDFKLRTCIVGCK